jgi:hypothetical protein
MLYVHGGTEIEQGVFRTERRGDWSAALPLVGAAACSGSSGTWGLLRRLAGYLARSARPAQLVGIDVRA